MSKLVLVQEHARIRGELSRRIGYTNGLHDIFRFARVVGYLHGLGPSSAMSLRSLILEREPTIRGRKYADGVIDAGRALGLIHKAGNTLTLSDTGYALYAVCKLDDSNKSTRAILLYSVLVHDGDAILNLLDIIKKGADPSVHGALLVDRLLGVLEKRRRWAEEQITDAFSRGMVLQDLAAATRRLSTAVDLERKGAEADTTVGSGRRLNAEQRLERFYAHTVNPRRGWLRDFGLVTPGAKGEFTVTVAGRRVLARFEEALCHVDSVFVLPFSGEVGEFLGAGADGGADDSFWPAVATSFEGPGLAVDFSVDECLDLVGRAYAFARFHLFNEAAIDSLYQAISAHLAATGKYVERNAFDGALEAASVEYPEKLYRLRQRHGRSGYVTMKA